MTYVPLAIYCPDQSDDDSESLSYAERAGLMLAPVAWSEGSPVVTLDAFDAFVAAHAANDRNGDWGHVIAHMTSDAGRVMVYVGADLWRALSSDDWPADGCTVADVVAIYGASVWAPGDSGHYRLSDAPGWDDWSGDSCPWSDVAPVRRPWSARAACAGPVVTTHYGDVCAAHRDSVASAWA